MSSLLNRQNCLFVLIIYVYIILCSSLVPVSQAFHSSEKKVNDSVQNETALSLFLSSTVVTKLTAHETESKFLRNLILSFICIPIMVSTLIGNMLVILAVVIVRKLHQQDNANNFLIVSLALSDFLVGVLVMPFAFYVEISEENK